MTVDRTLNESLFRGGLISFSIKILAAVSSFLVNLMLARLLGAEMAGLIFLSLSIVTIATVLARMGLGPVITRFTSSFLADDDWPKVNGLTRKSLLLAFGVSVAISVALATGGRSIGAQFFDKAELGPILQTMACSVVPLTLSFLIGHAFQGRNLINRCLFFQALGVSLAFLTLLAPLYWLELRDNFSGDTLIVSELYVISALGVLLMALLFWLIEPNARGPATTQRVGPLMKSALPLYGTAVLALVMQHAGQLTLGVHAGSSDVAVYVVSLRIAGLVTIVLAAFSSVAMPRFAALYHRGELDQLRITATALTRTITLLVLPVVLAVLVFPREILGIFGEDFLQGSGVLRILAIAQFFNVATGMVGGLLAMTGHGSAQFRASALASALMLILCVLIIPIFGVIGAAIAHAASTALQMTVNTLAVKTHLGFIPMLPRRFDGQPPRR